MATSGVTTVHPAKPAASRVVIVLFDRKLPQYADQFDMPNYGKLRDRGTNHKQAYPGYGPDVIGLEHDHSSYGVYGDHGGAQESVQRVPMVFWSPGMHGQATGEKFRTYDVTPTILRAMGIPVTTPMDGKAHSLQH